jgi:predicted nucleic acid-binding protein
VYDRTNIYLTDEQVAQLDRPARAEGVSRAELIRQLLDRLLHSESDRLSADVAAIDASFGISPTVAGRAGEFRRSYRRSHAAIGTADCLIAASADVNGFELATLNLEHFPMFEGLEPPFCL